MQARLLSSREQARDKGWEYNGTDVVGDALSDLLS